MKKNLASLTAIFLLATALSSGRARAADPVITDSKLTSIGVVSGGDVGEGLDLEGNFVYALAVGEPTDTDVKIRDATFVLIDLDPVGGASIRASNTNPKWYIVDYGDSPNDDNLELVTSSIRWANAATAEDLEQPLATPQIIVTLDNLEVGVEYKVQMTFGEECCNRGFDVFFDDVLVVKDFNPGVVHGGISEGTTEALITHLYTPKTTKAVIRLDGREASTDYSDHNAILNALTVEKLGVAVDTDKDGMPDSYETQNGFNPNDATDAAKDFDGDGVSNLDEFKAGTDPIDTTKPTIVSASTTGTFDTVNITFSEELDPATATAVGNYTITPSLAVTAATYKKKVVTLTTAKQTPGATAYTVTVKGAKDTSKNEVPADSKAVVYSYVLSKNGALKFSLWKNITGTPIQGLYDDPRYPNSPDSIGPVFAFNSREILPTDSLENYGATIEGFLTPTESASYDFFLRSDDASQLYLSTDDKEANLVQIAEETGCCAAFLEPGDPRTTAAPIPLVAGTKYFIRAVYKEGGGGDYVQVAWRKSTDQTPAAGLRPIPNPFLTAAEDLAAPAEGAFLIQTPAPNAKGVSVAPLIRIGHRDGKTEWTSANVSLKIDGVAVTPKFTKEGNFATIESQVSGVLPSKSTHTIALGYLDPAGQPATKEWSFETLAYSGSTKDKVAGYPGLIENSAVYTADGGGHTGKTGDYAMDMTKKGGPVEVLDTSWAKSAFAKDELTVSFWMKKYDISDATAFRFGATSTGRAYHAHVPWSDSNIYFDTAGCCTVDTQRINANIDTFAGYTGDIGFWTNVWHNFAFTKKAGNKQIWIDGQLFLAGDGANPLPSDLESLYIGSDGPGGSPATHALLDDFAVFSTQLAEADLKSLFTGTLPSALPATKGLIAYWDFNDATATPPPGSKFTGIRVQAGNVVIEYTGSGILQSADVVSGPYADVAGASSPSTVPVANAPKYYRFKP